jgi:hypothetical protein
MQIQLTAEEVTALVWFRRTGEYVGKDARWKYKHRKPGTRDEVLYRLREMGLLDHFCADQWYLTGAGRFMLKSA